VATTTVLFPLTVFLPGQYESPTVAVPAGITTVGLSVDRTVGAASLNSLLSTATAALTVFGSNDGGTTWTLWASVEFQGGLLVDQDTLQVLTATTLEWTTPLMYPLAKARLTVAGATISTSASLILS
jgi:hypothetical protein